MKGKYIVIEGGEGSGKTTQAELLVEYLNENNLPAVQCREPGSTPEAEKIRGILLEKENDLQPLTELFLFEAARHEFFVNEVLRNLSQGTNVVADRSGYSSEAYQGYAGGVDLDLIRELNAKATLDTKPDLFCIIDVRVSKGLKKEVDADRFAAKGLDYHVKVNQGYRQIAKREKDIAIVIPYVDGDVEGMQEQIRQETMRRLFSN